MDYKTKDTKYIANSYNRFPLTIVEGKGSYMYDESGKEYIDFGTGIGVNIFGTNDEVWKNAIVSQLNKIQHTSNLFFTEPNILLAEKLCLKTGAEKVFFCNSGAEANECAIKVARKYSSDKYGDKKYKIATLTNSFHGRTMATLSATGQDSFHQYFNPFLDGFIYLKTGDINGLKDLQLGEICAIMIEIVQGEGGVNVLDSQYLTAINKICQDNDILLIIDEVQTGNGRTGKLFAYQHFGLSPDIITTAKGLGGGLPIGATLMYPKTANVLTAGTHGSTFGGNLVVAAGALSILERLDDTFLQNVVDKGNYIKEELLQIPQVIEVSGLGMMVGIKTKYNTKLVIDKCREKGLIVLSAKDKIRLLPPLNIPKDMLAKGIDILKGVLLDEAFAETK